MSARVSVMVSCLSRRVDLESQESVPGLLVTRAQLRIGRRPEDEKSRETRFGRRTPHEERGYDRIAAPAGTWTAVDARGAHPMG